MGATQTFENMYSEFHAKQHAFFEIAQYQFSELINWFAISYRFNLIAFLQKSLENVNIFFNFNETTKNISI